MDYIPVLRLVFPSRGEWLIGCSAHFALITANKNIRFQIWQGKRLSRPISGQTTCRFRIRQSLCALDLIAPISELRTLPMLWRISIILILSPGIKAIAPLIVTCFGPTLVSHAPALLAINPQDGAPSQNVLVRHDFLHLQ